MAKIVPKNVVKMSLSGDGQTHARTRVAVRDAMSIIDEPVERSGTNLGITPTETLMSSLMGCTNVITKRIGHKMGIEMGNMSIQLTAQFDRRGTMLMEEIDHPFSDIVMDIELETDADAATMETIKEDLAKFCPIAKVIRNSGITITENWVTKPLG